MKKAKAAMLLPRTVFAQTPRCIQLAARRFLVFNVHVINLDYRSAKLILADRSDSLYKNADFSVKRPKSPLQTTSPFPFSYPLNYSHLTNSNRLKSLVRFVTFYKNCLRPIWLKKKHKTRRL
jgi:hypothetical protein